MTPEGNPGEPTAVEVVLDLDGPILDVAARHFAVYRDIAAELGFRALPFDAYWDGKRAPLGARHILESTAAAPFYTAFSQRWLQEIELDAYLKMDTVQPGAIESLERWASRGHRLILATMRQDARALARQLESLDLTRRFRAVVVCDRRTGGAGKAQSVATIVGKPPPLSYWIGDTEIDIVAARERGSVAWAVSCGLRSAQFLNAQSPDRLSATLAAIELDT
jgi:phosphoglycolate phosphatase-like HAD superfamily hydrolase